MSDPNRAENIRLAIAQQPSVEQGIAALFRAIATHLHRAHESNDLSELHALANHMNNDPRAWSDAVLANTPAAPQTIAPTVPQMPVYVQDAFRDHSVLAEEAQKRDAQQDQLGEQTPEGQQHEPGQFAQERAASQPVHNELGDGNPEHQNRLGNQAAREPAAEARPEAQ